MVSVRFGSASEARFGSCSVSVLAVPGRFRFGSVFGIYYVDICFFSGAGKANIN